MGSYRSALGKQVDMSALVAKNQKVRAVGNMGVNARGDTIDSNGKIIQPITEKVNNSYSKTVGNRGAQAHKSAPKKSNIKEDLTDYEKELEKDLLDDESEIEIIKKKIE